MSQTWTDNCYQLSHEGPADLQNIENNFSCLKSMFKGTVAPTISPVAGQRWYDFTHKLQRFYDGTNWVCLMPGDATQKIWSYCNSVVEGMVLVSITDKVLALKSTSGLYNVNGGNTAGDWNFAHTHGPGSFTVNTYHRHGLGIEETYGGMIWPIADYGWCYTDYQGSTTQAVTGASASGGGSSWRPAASIGIIQRPDM